MKWSICGKRNTSKLRTKTAHHYRIENCSWAQEREAVLLQIRWSWPWTFLNRRFLDCFNVESLVFVVQGVNWYKVCGIPCGYVRPHDWQRVGAVRDFRIFVSQMCWPVATSMNFTNCHLSHWLLIRSVTQHVWPLWGAYIQECVRCRAVARCRIQHLTLQAVWKRICATTSSDPWHNGCRVDLML